MLKISKLLSTFFGLGYLAASGSITSLVIFILAYLFVSPLDIIWRALIFIVGLLILWPTTEIFRNKYNYQDPHFIVSDEIIGSLLIIIFLPQSIWLYAVGLIAFRLFDITKWAGINYLQSLPKTLGIMADDILAGIYATIITLVVERFL